MFWVLSEADAPGRDVALRLGYLAILVALAVVDVRRQVIPNALVYAALLAVLIIAAIEPQYTLGDGLTGGAVAALPFLGLFALAPGSIGGGDVKMAALVGAMVGWPDAFTALVVAALAGGACATFLVATGRREGRMPYGPFLALGGATLISGPLVLFS